MAEELLDTFDDGEFIGTQGLPPLASGEWASEPDPYWYASDGVGFLTAKDRDAHNLVVYRAQLAKSEDDLIPL